MFETSPNVTSRVCYCQKQRVKGSESQLVSPKVVIVAF